MAKAVFQKNQRVWVDTVGALATVEKITPIWAKGFDEPVRITYDVGLGREFMAHELRAEDRNDEPIPDTDTGDWRVLRARNKWQNEEHCAHHPYPGSFPIVVTDKQDWGGWRVPGAEYDRDPERMEFQARLIANTPKLLKLARELTALVAENPDDAPEAVLALARQASAVLRRITEAPETPAPEMSAAAA
jgi:hypothetical protein